MWRANRRARAPVATQKRPSPHFHRTTSPYNAPHMKPANSVVAVVDDEDNIRETVAFAVRREGYPVELYATGLEAWRVFQQKLPGLVILDITMPEMDGLELCRRIRSLSETIPIIFLTSRDQELDRVLGLEIGADDYLCKPFSMRELLARVKVLFRRAAYDQNT